MVEVNARAGDLLNRVTHFCGNRRQAGRRRRSAVGTGSVPQPSTKGSRSTVGFEVFEAKPQKLLEDENRKLKRLLAEQVMDNATLKEMLTKNF